MADREKSNTPPKGTARRMQSQTERDVSGLAAKAIRESQSIPDEVDDEVTAQYEAGQIDEEELEDRRSRRPTLERLRRQEKKTDGLVKAVGDLTAKVEGIEGEMKHIPNLIRLLEKSLERTGETASAAIADQFAANKQRRELFNTVVGRVLAAAGAIGLIVLAVLQAQAQGCGR